MRIGRTTGWALAALVAVACELPGGPELTGEWSGEAPGGGETTWTFAEDGALSWDIEGAPEGLFDGLRYEVVASGERRSVDITGFGQEPMVGQALYCIVEHPTETTLRIDCEAGPEGDDSIRPTEFGAETLELTRVGGGETG